VPEWDPDSSAAMEQKATSAACVCIPVSTAKQSCLSQPHAGSKRSPGGTILSDKPLSVLGFPLEAGGSFLFVCFSPLPFSLFSTAGKDWSHQGDFLTSLEPSVQLHTAFNPEQSHLKGSASFNHLGKLRFVSVNPVLPCAREKQGDGAMGNDAEMRPVVLKSSGSSAVHQPQGRPGGLSWFFTYSLFLFSSMDD